MQSLQSEAQAWKMTNVPISVQGVGNGGIMFRANAEPKSLVEKEISWSMKEGEPQMGGK